MAPTGEGLVGRKEGLVGQKVTQKSQLVLRRAPCLRLARKFLFPLLDPPG